MSRPAIRHILASHLVFTGYAHWLSNDPRGSGSTDTRKDELRELGDIHLGRKRVQPSREELRKFRRDADNVLQHEIVWFRDAHRTHIANAIGSCAKLRGYTLWACAICSNHAHIVVRTHRDHAEEIWHAMSIATSSSLRNPNMVSPDHPVWSHRPYKVFLYTPDEVAGRIDYVVQNPQKEGLPRQYWDFVQPYNGK
jgi:REP element-mobilizing transposase RayT